MGPDNAIKELILDEHKVVTYISVSKDLCIHVNEAKSLLHQIIQDIRKTQPEIILSVSYMISGMLKNNSACTMVCSETDLDTVKKNIKNIFYEHVYSVSRGSADNITLTTLNQFDDLPLCTGLIKANSCMKRIVDEIQNLKLKNQDALSLQRPINVQQKNGKVLEVRKHENVKTVSEIKSESNGISEILSPKKETKKTSTSSNKSAPKSIAGFFSKANNSDSVKAKKVSKPEIKSEKAEVAASNLVSDDAKNIKDKTIKNNTLTKIKNNAKVDKKRKRLLHVSDSESESEENVISPNEMEVDNESDDEIPPTPSVNTVKVTSGIVNPKKRRKIVDKTYTDDDGYILTKKEEVYESCSENDEDKDVMNAEQIEGNNEKQKENGLHLKENIKNANGNIDQQIKTEISPKEKKAKKKKVSPPQKGKQSTINNFFKKV